MPFGLTIVVFTFDHLENNVFKLSLLSLLESLYMALQYISTQDHLKVWLAFKRLDECKMQLNPEKCHIG